MNVDRVVGAIIDQCRKDVNVVEQPMGKSLTRQSLCSRIIRQPGHLIGLSGRQRLLGTKYLTPPKVSMLIHSRIVKTVRLAGSSGNLSQEVLEQKQKQWNNPQIRNILMILDQKPGFAYETTWASPGEQVTSTLDRLKLNLNIKEQVKTVDVVKREPKDDHEDSDGHQLKDAVTYPVQVAIKYPIEDTTAEIDEDELNDPTMCAEYVEEIFEYYKVLELQTLPSAEYMDHQDDLDWEKRGKLIDWLIVVSTHFHLRPETLFLAVNIIDRFLSQQVVPRDKLQLVGITAMLIACKYEEVQSRAVDEFVEFAIDTFPDDIHSSERYILVTLKFDLSYPNPMNFLRRISKADNYYIKTRTLGKYLMEVSLVDHRFLRYKQSHIAAAAMYLARMVLRRGPWNATLVRFAGYTEKQITPVFKLMIEYHKEPVTHKAFFAKYTRMEYSAASILTREWVKQS